jgi:hypothetical protein
MSDRWRLDSSAPTVAAEAHQHDFNAPTKAGLAIDEI